MKTLIFNGSPRPKGETRKMINMLSEELGGDIKVVNTYTAGIHPCVDCRFCHTHDGCVIKDDMQTIYQDIQEADCIIIASPIYYEQLTGILLATMSRLQTYFCAKYMRGQEPIQKKKKGAILLSAGSFGRREKAEATANLLLKEMRCEYQGTVYIGKTDEKGLEERSDIIEQIHDLAGLLKEQQEMNDK